MRPFFMMGQRSSITTPSRKSFGSSDRTLFLPGPLGSGLKPLGRSRPRCQPRGEARSPCSRSASAALNTDELLPTDPTAWTLRSKLAYAGVGYCRVAEYEAVKMFHRCQARQRSVCHAGTLKMQQTQA